MSGSHASVPVALAAPRVVGLWWWLAIGGAAAVVGVLPWLVTGAELPLQNLWASDGSVAMPVALLPLSQYSITVVFGLVVTGAAIAGAVARWTPAHQPAHATLVVVIGTLSVQLIAAAQSLIVTARGLEEGRWATIYLIALGAVVVLSLAIGLTVLLLVAKSAVPGAAVGLSVASFAVSAWLAGLIAPMGSVPGDAAVWVLGWLRWVPSIIIGAVIAWCGFRTVGRVLAIIFSLLLLWVAPALITAVSSAAGTRVLAGYPDQMLDYGIQVFRSALTIPELVLPPIALAAVVAVLGTLVRVAVSRRSAVEPSGA